MLQFGPPSLVEVAYLAGILERGGLSPAGIKVRCHQPTGQWLIDRFGGTWYDTASKGTWWLRSRDEVSDTLQRVAPFMIDRREQAEALLAGQPLR